MSDRAGVPSQGNLPFPAVLGSFVHPPTKIQCPCEPLSGCVLALTSAQHIALLKRTNHNITFLGILLLSLVPSTLITTLLTFLTSYTFKLQRLLTLDRRAGPASTTEPISDHFAW